jgi:hypothetical protein
MATSLCPRRTGTPLRDNRSGKTAPDTPGAAQKAVMKKALGKPWLSR